MLIFPSHSHDMSTPSYIIWKLFEIFRSFYSPEAGSIEATDKKN